MNVTIKDVAREAGVSKSTVSLVINHSSSIKLETQYKVREAIQKLGYVPNVSARGLITNRTQTLGMIFLTSNPMKRPYAFDSIPETLLYDASNGIYSGLQNTNYALLTERFSDELSREALPALVREGRVDGVFLIGGLFSPELISHLKSIGLPSVVIGRQFEGIDCVYCNMEEVGSLAGKELCGAGCRNILFVNGPSASMNSRKKLAGLQRSLRELGMSPGSLHTIYSRYTGADAYQAIRRAWEDGLRPDAVFGASDGITAGVLRFLYQKGLRVPDDISVIGYESSLLTEYAPVPLTVIDAHKEKMGEEACKALLNRIRHSRASQVNLEISPVLIAGSSIAKKGSIS